MKRFKRTFAMLTMAFLLLCISAASSQAAMGGMPNANLSIDWTSFQVTQYQGFPFIDWTVTDLTSEVNEGGDYVDVDYNSLSDWDSKGDWYGVTIVTGNQARAETTQDNISTTASLENGGYAYSYADRHGYLILNPGLVYISVAYDWSMWADQEPGSKQSANLNIHLAAYDYRSYGQDWSTSKYISMGDWGNTTDQDGSGLLELFFLVNETGGEYGINLHAGVNVSAPLSNVPVPGSALMLFSGLIGLVMARRQAA